MNIAQSLLINGQKTLNRPQRPMAYNKLSKPISTSSSDTKFWGIWLPVPTFLAMVNSLFWTWLILSTVGYSEKPIEKAGEWIIEQF